MIDFLFNAAFIGALVAAYWAGRLHERMYRIKDQIDQIRKELP